MVTKAEEIKENINPTEDFKVNGQFGNKWYKVSYQQTKVDGNYIDDESKPKIFLIGQGKNVMKLSMEETLSFTKIVIENKKLLTLFLKEERKLLKETGTFDQL